MGIHINVLVSKAVTKKEWEEVYKESLALAKSLPLAEIKTVNIAGTGILADCLVGVEEHEMPYLCGYGSNMGWQASGDLYTLHTCETYFMPRDLITDEAYDQDAGDPLIYTMAEYLGKEVNGTKPYLIFGAKTQGEPYHNMLLSVACLVEDRLRSKALVFGDITKGQCEAAVRQANKYLDKPISVPDQCEIGRLWERVSALPFENYDKLLVFEYTYMGRKDENFGFALRQLFGKEICDKYWREMLANWDPGKTSYSKVLKDYLSWGFSIKEICSFLQLRDGDEEQYAGLIRNIMDSKLHIKEKDCTDVLEVSPDSQKPYSINTLMAQFLFSSLHNRKVDRYIPIDEIRFALKAGLSTKCVPEFVDQVIDEYLAEEARERNTDESGAERQEMAEGQKMQNVVKDIDTFQKTVRVGKELFDKEEEKYDIADYRRVIFFENGDCLAPVIESSLITIIDFFNEVIQKEAEEYGKLLQEPAHECCRWLVKHNIDFFLRASDWEHIFLMTQAQEKNFARYYAATRTVVDRDDVLHYVRALMVNDDLYEFAKELAEKKKKGE